MHRRIAGLLVWAVLTVSVLVTPPSASAGTNVILGDSIMNALNLYPDLIPSNSVVLAAGGSQVGLLTVLASYVATLQPSKIFIMDGVNDVNNTPISTFTSIYDYLLGYFEMTVPTATVYVQSILPVNLTDYSSSTKATNSAIAEYNAALQSTVAQHSNATYLNISSSFTNASGNLIASYTDDGVHLNEAGLSAWNGIMSAYF